MSWEGHVIRREKQRLSIRILLGGFWLRGGKRLNAYCIAGWAKFGSWNLVDTNSFHTLRDGGFQGSVVSAFGAIGGHFTEGFYLFFFHGQAAGECSGCTQKGCRDGHRAAAVIATPNAAQRSLEMP